MATRAERMQQRLRGAQRHQVEVDDLDFSGLFPVDSFPVTAALPESDSTESSSPAPTPLPPPRPPSTRSPLPKPIPVPTKAEQPLRRSPRNVSPQVPAAEAAPTKEPTPQPEPEPEPEPILKPEPPSVPPLQEPSSPLEPPALSSPAPDDLDELPTNTPPRLSVHEIEESPANVPGSGQRKPVSVVPLSANRLQSIMSDDLAEMNSSSPLTRKSRMASRQKTQATRASRVSRLAETAIQEVDELSPKAKKIAKKPKKRPSREIPASPEPEEPHGIQMEPKESIIPTDAQFSDDEAVGVGDDEGVIQLSRKPTIREDSPELHSEPARQSSPFMEEPTHIAPSPSPSPEPELRVQPAAARNKKRHVSNSFQSNTQSQENTTRPRAKKPKKSHSASNDKRSNRLEDLDDKTTIPITVQRYKLPKRPEGDDDIDDLAADIPFTSRGGVNTVDVLNQVCEEVLDTSLSQLLEVLPTAEASARKDIKTKIHALEAFQEELKSRLLAHTIYLDTLHGLKKRLRKAAADKARLRAEIMEMRQEREQIALRMDAARAKHDENTVSLERKLKMSAAMYDVEMVLNVGANAPELDAAEERDVELANLEVIIASVAEQASKRGPGGGALTVIKEFNQFLERAALALEGR